MAKRFVTLFTSCENVHLTKDLGQIPFFLHKKYGYDSSIVTYKNSEVYSNLDTEVKGLRLEFIKNEGRISFLEIAILKYIWKNAKQIEVLNIYIFSKFSFVYGILYKLLNPTGFLFLKLDGYNETFEKEHTIKHSINPIKNAVLARLERTFLQKVDLITIENSLGKSLVKNKFPKIQDMVMYLPVGVNDDFLKTHFDANFKSFEEKENIILTVGRIGEPIKNNEMMMRALAQLKLKEWKMVFIGAINTDFKAYLNEWFEEHPHLKDQVIFTGEITDRLALYEWYNKSKIFCMTSWKESFCHSIGEAIYFGNYIVGTEGIVSMTDLSDHQKYGKIIKSDDDTSLVQELQNLMDNQLFLASQFPKIVQHSHSNFVWSSIVDKIHNRLSK